MMNARAKVQRVVKQDGTLHGWAIHCPGCDDVHVFDGRWTFNGDVDKPTFRASLIVHPVNDPDGTVVQPRCHSFVTDGRIEFLGDCTHALVGKTFDLPAWRDKHPGWCEP